MLHSLDHHAYGISEVDETVLLRLLSMLKKQAGFAQKGNPDFRLEQYETMGVHEARSIKESAERKAVSGKRKVFVISARGMTREAQNALLKIFEEPPVDTHFFLLVPSLELLLPTLRSRLQTLEVASDAEEADREAVVKFISDSVPARLRAVQKMLKGLEQEKKTKEDSSELLLEKGHIMTFLTTLERTLADKDRARSVPALQEMLLVKKYSRDRAPSLKLLLEHLALVLPREM